MKISEEFLKNNGVKPSPVRLLVINTIADSDSPLSALDIEIRLATVDHSSISRSLNTLLDADLIHAIHDGSGAVKYECCPEPEHHGASHTHVHFRCRKCGRTECLPKIPVPRVTLPSGYEPEDANYILTGLCPRCR